jgi:subtilisin-like proprotein convertase family protein
MEFRFMNQEPVCGGAGATYEYSFLGGTWLENDHDLDYTLIQAPAGEEPASTYGWLLFDDRLPDIDEAIYIVGHPGWGPKQISLYSSHPEDQDNPDGFCEVFSLDEPACLGGTVPEIGYYCDTQGGGSSGSPVLSRATDKVVALHHCADCPNRGVRIQNIWDHNQSGPNALPACSLFEDVGLVKLGAAAYRCTAAAGLQVMDGSLRGAGTQTVSIWSDTETNAEDVTLAETGTATGVFTGSIGLTGSAPAGGDGLLSVAHGDTLTVLYVDADDGQGGTDIPRQDDALVDCLAPIISNLRVEDVLGLGATVRWDTDEPADSTVFYSATPPNWSMAVEGTLVTEHALRLEGLIPCTDYAFWVQSADSVGNEASDDNGGGWHSFSTGVDVQPLYSNSHSVQIKDNRNAVSTIQVPDLEVIQDLDVTVNITHTYIADVDMYLMGPNGVEIELSSDNGLSEDNYTATTFDDEAAMDIIDAPPPFTGTFRPEQPLALFDGISAAGPWTLRAFDDSDGDEGTLDSWSIRFLYPARPCGPQPSYAGHAPGADVCAPGEPGHEDGIWDAGEAVSFHVTLENIGTDPVTGILGTLTSLTCGVVVTGDTSAFPDLPPGAAGVSLSGFASRLSAILGCGQLVTFRLDIQANEGAWTETFQQVIGLPSSGAGTVLAEGFDAGIPGTWTIVDGGSSPHTWYADGPVDPLGCTSPDPAIPIAGSWAAVDSDCAGAVDMDEALVTPALDLSFATGAALEFDHYFNRYETETADLDVRSSLTGGSWVNLHSWGNDTANPQHELFDISAQAAGAEDVEIRWHYHGANFEWYWFVDNIQVTYTSPSSCDLSPCGAAGAIPGEQSGARWLDAGTYTWDPDPQATGGYLLYRGEGGDLPTLMNSAPDSCRRFAGTADVVDLSLDDPGSTRGLTWYLVTGWNDAGEGTPGDGTMGTRIVDTIGPCPP